MKLGKILAMEMTAWPSEGTDIVGQAVDGTLHLGRDNESDIGFTNESYTRASDWLSAHVTRDEWESARKVYLSHILPGVEG